MKWQEIRKHYADGKRFLEQLAVVDTFPDSVTAMKRYAQLHRDMPAREYYVFHSSRETLEVIERR